MESAKIENVAEEVQDRLQGTQRRVYGSPTTRGRGKGRGNEGGAADASGCGDWLRSTGHDDNPSASRQDFNKTRKRRAKY